MKGYRGSLQALLNHDAVGVRCVRDPLIKSTVDCVAGKTRMDARRATKVVAWTTKPRRARVAWHLRSCAAERAVSSPACGCAGQRSPPRSHVPRLHASASTTQTSHFAATQMGRLPRHGQRSLGCGSGSMSAPFYNVSCGSLRPFPHHAARDRVRGAFPGGLLCRSAYQGVWLLAAPRFAHPIPESRRRNRAGLNQRFLSA